MEKLMKDQLLSSLPKECINSFELALEVEGSAAILETGHPERSSAKYERAIVKQNWVIIYLLNELRKSSK